MIVSADDTLGVRTVRSGIGSEPEDSGASNDVPDEGSKLPLCKRRGLLIGDEVNTSPLGLSRVPRFIATTIS
jgi:hypothetical protein